MVKELILIFPFFGFVFFRCCRRGLRGFWVFKVIAALFLKGLHFVLL